MTRNLLNNAGFWNTKRTPSPRTLSLWRGRGRRVAGTVRWRNADAQGERMVAFGKRTGQFVTPLQGFLYWSERYLGLRSRTRSSPGCNITALRAWDSHPSLLDNTMFSPDHNIKTVRANTGFGRESGIAGTACRGLPALPRTLPGHAHSSLERESGIAGTARGGECGRGARTDDFICEAIGNTKRSPSPRTLSLWRGRGRRVAGTVHSTERVRIAIPQADGWNIKGNPSLRLSPRSCLAGREGRIAGTLRLGNADAQGGRIVAFGKRTGQFVTPLQGFFYWSERYLGLRSRTRSSPGCNITALRACDSHPSLLDNTMFSPDHNIKTVRANTGLGRESGIAGTACRGLPALPRTLPGHAHSSLERESGIAGTACGGECGRGARTDDFIWEAIGNTKRTPSPRTLSLWRGRGRRVAGTVHSTERVRIAIPQTDGWNIKGNPSLQLAPRSCLAGREGRIAGAARLGNADAQGGRMVAFGKRTGQFVTPLQGFFYWSERYLGLRSRTRSSPGCNITALRAWDSHPSLLDNTMFSPDHNIKTVRANTGFGRESGIAGAACRGLPALPRTLPGHAHSSLERESGIAGAACRGLPALPRTLPGHAHSGLGRESGIAGTACRGLPALPRTLPGHAHSSLEQESGIAGTACRGLPALPRTLPGHAHSSLEREREEKDAAIIHLLEAICSLYLPYCCKGMNRLPMIFVMRLNPIIGL